MGAGVLINFQLPKKAMQKSPDYLTAVSKAWFVLDLTVNSSQSLNPTNVSEESNVILNFPLYQRHYLRKNTELLTVAVLTSIAKTILKAFSIKSHA